MNTDNLYKIIHRNYQNITELYDDLKDKITSIELRGDIITICYNEETYAIQQFGRGYRTWINGRQEKGETEDQDIYDFAIEFVHEKQIGLKELQIVDNNIIQIDEKGIEYKDFFDRIHLIDFHICRRNYALYHPQPSKCIAERDYTKFEYYFLYEDIVVKIKICNWYLFKKKHRVLHGTRIERFESFKKLICEYGYTILDLS